MQKLSRKKMICHHQASPAAHEGAVKLSILANEVSELELFGSGRRLNSVALHTDEERFTALCHDR